MQPDNIEAFLRSHFPKQNQQTNILQLIEFKEANNGLLPTLQHMSMLCKCGLLEAIQLTRAIAKHLGISVNSTFHTHNIYR